MARTKAFVDRQVTWKTELPQQSSKGPLAGEHDSQVGGRARLRGRYTVGSQGFLISGLCRPYWGC